MRADFAMACTSRAGGRDVRRVESGTSAGSPPTQGSAARPVAARPFHVCRWRPCQQMPWEMVFTASRAHMEPDVLQSGPSGDFGGVYRHASHVSD